MSSICHSYVTRMYSYVIPMSPICTRVSSICHPYVICMYSYDVGLLLLCSFTINHKTLRSKDDSIKLFRFWEIFCKTAWTLVKTEFCIKCLISHSFVTINGTIKVFPLLKSEMVRFYTFHVSEFVSFFGSLLTVVNQTSNWNDRRFYFSQYF